MKNEIIQAIKDYIINNCHDDVCEGVVIPAGFSALDGSVEGISEYPIISKMGNDVFCFAEHFYIDKIHALVEYRGELREGVIYPCYPAFVTRYDMSYEELSEEVLLQILAIANSISN